MNIYIKYNKCVYFLYNTYIYLYRITEVENANKLVENWLCNILGTLYSFLNFVITEPLGIGFRQHFHSVGSNVSNYEHIHNWQINS